MHSRSMLIPVCGQGQSQLITASKIFTESENSQAQVVVATHVEWNLDRKCLDRTSFHTDCKNEACMLIEQKLAEISYI